MENIPEISLLIEILHGELHKRHGAFALANRNLAAECAAKGLRGGPHIDATYLLCIREADERIDLITSTIKQNLLDTTYEVSPDQVLQAFDSTNQLDLDLVGAVDSAVKASGVGLASGHSAALRDEIARRVKAARAGIEFFSRSPRRANSSGVTIQGDTANVQSGGVANVTQYIGSTIDALRNDGALAQIKGLLDLIERRLDEAIEKNTSLASEDVASLEPIFKVAYSVDVSTAATGVGVNVGDSYHHVSGVQRDCVELGKLHDEVVRFNADFQRGHYYETGDARVEAFRKRRDAGVEAIRAGVAGARAALERSDATTIADEIAPG